MLLNRAIDAKSMLWSNSNLGVPVPFVPVTFLWKVMKKNEKVMKSNDKL